MKKKKVSGKSRDDKVLTPAGPVRRDQVHEVQPGDEVQRFEDGSYKIVSRRAKTKR